jgi:hypothetical protein
VLRSDDLEGQRLDETEGHRRATAVGRPSELKVTSMPGDAAIVRAQRTQAGKAEACL